MSIRYADDLRVGDTFALGTYTVSRTELLEFARQWDPQAFHIDAEAAARGPFGDVIASGAHTMAVFQRLSVLGAESEWAVIAGVRLVDVRFPRPVRPDTTLTGGVRIDAIDFDPVKKRALILKAGWLDDDGGRVLEIRSEALLQAR
ncbi:MaoC/PaaZ C-terminal domain-containing protein [Dactylosporangium sp. CS-033363]|uniref:MaoC/PaaZ C-terminal domain-containing protein n=1 Tax=Dactylosporangium sp. CS-033363 TaxID=3239935 RepID=UPI003D8B79B7